MAISLKTQTVYWPSGSGSAKEYLLDSITVPVVDTVYSFESMGNLFNYYITPEFDMKMLDGTVYIDLGGGNTVIRTTPRLFSFNAFQCDSCHYLLHNTMWRDTINGVAQNKKALPVTIPYSYKFFALKLTRGTCTAGKKLRLNIKATKP